jgi:endonuclease/exonuclease/phosphatase family metal-dependent hydrolase
MDAEPIVFHIRLCAPVAAIALLLAGCGRAGAIDPEARPRFMQEPSRPHVRVLSYNVGWDSIFETPSLLGGLWRDDSRGAAFLRIIKATDPDVICLQEIDPARDPQQVADMLDEAVPLADGLAWQVHSGQDNVVAARYELRMRAQQLAYRGDVIDLGHAMTLVDLPNASFPQDLYVICAHFQALAGQQNTEARQMHADMIIAWIRDAQTPGGEVELAPNTPLVVLGDFNVYDTDPAHHLTTLLSGDIFDEGMFGPDAAPDWDGTALADAMPTHNGEGEERYTWRDDTSVYGPGILDRILYADSTLTAAGGFVLDTTSMGEAALAATGLRADDVMLDPDAGVYDHLPMVVDFELRPDEVDAPQ